ncbi:MAG: uncharacterized protein A8A55_0671 [Amphiamblys sp. WSBS2006]|nr:MAG: uncharacterized protein A8A55_0671 [Amphiamblys sp. WSBS2006]
MNIGNEMAKLQTQTETLCDHLDSTQNTPEDTLVMVREARAQIEVTKRLFEEEYTQTIERIKKRIQLLSDVLGSLLQERQNVGHTTKLFLSQTLETLRKKQSGTQKHTTRNRYIAIIFALLSSPALLWLILHNRTQHCLPA